MWEKQRMLKMRCRAPFCKNASDDVSTESKGISFHAFPNEVDLRAAWLRALGKQDSLLPDSAVICSQHFLDDDICATESGLRQLAPGAVPSTVQVCMICFDTDSRLFLMSKHKMEEAYEKLTGYPPCDVRNLKQALCIQCAQRLRTFSRFRDKSLRARAIMMDLVDKHELITKQHIKLINRTKNQIDNSFVMTALGPDPCDLHIQEHPSEEQQTNLEVTLQTVEVKKEDSYDSMPVDEDMAVANDDSNAEYVKDELVASDDSILAGTKKLDDALSEALVINRTVVDQVDKIQDLLKYESDLFQCSLCYEEFKAETAYERHMGMHGQERQAGAAASSSCPDSSLRTPHKMPPAKSRGHMLVNLVKKTDRTDANESIEPIIADDSISEQGLHYSVEFQNSRCCDVLTENIETNSPNIEFLAEPVNSIPCNYDVGVTSVNTLTEDNDDCNNSQEIAAKRNGRPPRGRKRKYADQNRAIRKQKANTNKEYISAKGKKVNAKEFKGSKFDCKCPLQCTEKISAEQRKRVFEKFWSLGSYEARCVMLQWSVTQNKKARSYSVSSKRVFTRKYNLAGVQVCKKTFLNTLAISQTRIDLALKKLEENVINDERTSRGKNSISPEKEEQIIKFIERLPKYISDYCRKDETAECLVPNLNVSRVYDLYKKMHENHVSLSKFRLCYMKKFI